HFDYLSSVSGGGYIASWLSGWIRRTEGGLTAILPDLAGHRKRPLQPEAAPIVHLRAYSNYLTPRVGGLSLDGWTVGMIFLRNLLLHWLVLVPVFAAVLALPLLAIAYIEPPSAFVREILFRLGLIFEGIGLMFMFALRGIASRELPVQGEGADRPPKRREHFVFLGLLPILIATALLATAASWTDPRDPVLLASALIGVVVPAMAFAVSVPLQAYLGYGPCAVASDLAALVVSGAITATLYAFLFAHATAILSPVPHGWAMLGPGLLLAPFM